MLYNGAFILTFHKHILTSNPFFYYPRLQVGGKQEKQMWMTECWLKKKKVLSLNEYLDIDISIESISLTLHQYCKITNNNICYFGDIHWYVMWCPFTCASAVVVLAVSGTSEAGLAVRLAVVTAGLTVLAAGFSGWENGDVERCNDMAL